MCAHSSMYTHLCTICSHYRYVCTPWSYCTHVCTAHSAFSEHICALSAAGSVQFSVCNVHSGDYSPTVTWALSGLHTAKCTAHCTLQQHTAHYKVHSTQPTTNYTAHTAHTVYSTSPLPLTVRCTTQWNSCLGGARSFGLPGCQELLWLSSTCHPPQFQP